MKGLCFFIFFISLGVHSNFANDSYKVELYELNKKVDHHRLLVGRINRIVFSQLVETKDLVLTEDFIRFWHKTVDENNFKAINRSLTISMISSEYLERVYLWNSNSETSVKISKAKRYLATLDSDLRESMEKRELKKLTSNEFPKRSKIIEEILNESLNLKDLISVTRLADHLARYYSGNFVQGTVKNEIEHLMTIKQGIYRKLKMNMNLALNDLDNIELANYRDFLKTPAAKEFYSLQTKFQLQSLKLTLEKELKRRKS